MTFRVHEHPSRDLCERMAGLSPANPFMTAAYLEARAALGGEPLILALENGEHIHTACAALLRSGYLTRSLEVVSLPVLPEPDDFWRGLRAWCRRGRVSQLEVNSFGSEQAGIPFLDGETSRRARCEYVLDLREQSYGKEMSSNHLRNVKRARKGQVSIHRSRETAACRLHVSLMASSMTRRRERGEHVPDETTVQLAEVTALIERGAGELFQAVVDGRVVSSILVLQSARGGYYHSAGTSPEGLLCGASHALVYDIAAALQAEAKWQFNLGGVSEPGSGLEQFKRGFGARGIPLQAVQCSTGGRLGAGAHILRQMAAAGAAR
jgi:lipid II:glycine glycyltransferase (peptidoglycan interpeptide bridge formation enzyme)